MSLHFDIYFLFFYISKSIFLLIIFFLYQNICFDTEKMNSRYQEIHFLYQQKSHFLILSENILYIHVYIYESIILKRHLIYTRY
jgi:hypothetical protein